MEKFKKIVKIFFIIISFLLINIAIDATTGAFVPMVVSILKTGDPANSLNYMVYGLFFGQLVKFTILVFYMEKRDKTFRLKLDRPYILKEKIEKPIKLVGIGFGTIGFGLILTNIIMKAFEDTDLMKAALDLMENAFKGESPLDGIIIIIVIAIGAPVVEELLFRGVLFEEINRETSKKMTIFLTAFIFGIYHFNIIQTPNTFFMGLVLAYLYEKTKSIKAPMIVHATNNIMATIPLIDRGLSIEGLIIYGIFIIIGIYSFKTLRQNA